MNHCYYESLAEEAMHLTGPTDMRRRWAFLREVVRTYGAADRPVYLAMLRRVTHYANADWQNFGPGRWIRM